MFFYVIFSIYVTMYHRVKAFIEFIFRLILCFYLIITIILPTVFPPITVREISELEKMLWILVKGNSVLFIKKQNKTNTNINYFCDRFFWIKINLKGEPSYLSTTEFFVIMLKRLPYQSLFEILEVNENLIDHFCQLWMLYTKMVNVKFRT